jgi:hypothetical protein
MKIVNKENDRPAGHSQWSRRLRSVVGIAECSEFAFSRTACSDTLEEGYRARFAVHHQFKLIPLQSFDKISFLVEHCNGRLDQFDIGADDLGLLLGWRRLLSARYRIDRYEQKD